MFLFVFAADCALKKELGRMKTENKKNESFRAIFVIRIPFYNYTRFFHKKKAPASKSKFKKLNQKCFRGSVTRYFCLAGGSYSYENCVFRCEDCDFFVKSDVLYKEFVADLDF